MGKHRQRHQQQEEEKPNAPLSRNALLSLPSDEQITKIRDDYQLIMVSPQTHVRSIETLFVFSKANNVRVATTAMRTLAEVFVGVAPLEPIDVKQLEQRRAVTVTKEEFAVMKFEETLVVQYQRYIRMLGELNSKLTPASFEQDQEMFSEFKKCILQCVAKCYQSLWNFNHFKELNSLALKFLKHQECRAFMRQLLADKNLGTLKAKAVVVGSIAALVKDRHENSLPDDLIAVVNCTHIDSRYLEKEKNSLDFKKKKMKKKLYRQQAMDEKEKKGKPEKGTLEMKRKIKQEKAKQKMRVREEVNKQFAEGEALLSKKQLVKGNSEILQELFYIYFKVLTERANSKFLRDCLEGVLAFAHLITIDLVEGLIARLDAAALYMRELWRQNKEQRLMTNRMYVVFTAESLLNGPLSIFSMDDLKATTNLFKILRDLNQSKTSLTKEQFRVLAMTLEEALLKRRQLSQEVVGSLLRELSQLIGHKEVPKGYMLELVRQIASKYSRVSKMFEEDNEGFGLNSFNPHSQDPQSSNAIHTQIISLLRQAIHTKAKKQKPLYFEEVERLGRQTFQRPQGCKPLEEWLKADLEGFESV